MLKKIIHIFRLLKSRLEDRNTETVFMHIGKCGGSTVQKELKQQNIKFVYRHVQKTSYDSTKKYIIVIRNPISRFISALNWRYKLVCNNGVQSNRFKGEKELLERYPTLNILAENLYKPDGTLNIDFSNKSYYIHHITEDIHYYLGNILDQGTKESIKAVLVTETLNKDLKQKFNIEVTEHRKKNSENSDKYLTELGYFNLKKYLQNDYDCINKIYMMNLISEEQYEILSK